MFRELWFQADEIGIESMAKSALQMQDLPKMALNYEQNSSKIGFSVLDFLFGALYYSQKYWDDKWLKR